MDDAVSLPHVDFQVVQWLSEHEMIKTIKGASFDVAPIDAPEKVVSWFGVWMAEAAWDEMMRDD
jgi:hypothetical protein